MSEPTFQTVHTDRPLTNMSVAFMQDPGDFGAMSIFPRVGVPKASDKYYTFPRDYWFSSNARRRGAGSPAPIGGYTLSTDNFVCERDSIAKAINDPTRANADDALDPDQEAVQWTTQQLLIKMEERFATAWFTTSIWTGSSTGSDITPSVLWDDASSDPVRDVKTQRRAVIGSVGGAYSPNVFVVGAKVYDDLTEHPDILDRIKYTAGAGNPAIANRQTLAQLFEVDRIVVLRGVKNTSNEGTAASYSFIANSRSAALLYAAPSPGLYQPSAGYTFMWNAAPDGSSFGPAIKRWRDEKNESDIIENNVWYQQKVVSASLGVYFSNAVAA